MSWEQIGNSIKFAAQFKASKLGKTGLADVVVYVYNPAGTLVVNGVAATELAYGIYTYTLASGSVATVGEYYCVFKTADATVDDKEIVSAWTVGRAGVEYLDASIDGVPGDTLDELVPGAYASGTVGYALGRIGSGQITTVYPVMQNNAVTIVQGDDYDADEALALDWTDTTAQWPTLTGATITLGVKSASGVTTYAGSVVTATGDSKKVRVELTSAQTSLLPVGNWNYDVQATLVTTSRKITLVRGTFTVLASVTP